MLHVYRGNNVGHLLYPWTAGQTDTLTYIMSSRSTSLEPKSQLTINLDPGWECSSLPSEENKTKKRKFPIKDRRKARRKFPIKRSEESKKKVPNQRLGVNKEKRKFPIKRSEESRRNIQKGLWTRQYLNNTKLSQVNKKRKETMTWC